MSLNNEQQLAVTHTSSPLLVLAGAGSGKTRVITYKIAHLIENCNIKANKIIAVTFTNKAAREMAERVSKKLGDKPKGLIVSTFHTLGLKFIQQEAKSLGIKANFSIYDNEDSIKLLKEILCQEHDVDKEEIAGFQQRISWCKGENITPENIMTEAKTDGDVIFARLFEAYERQLRSYNAVDFDDLILLPLKTLQENHAIREKWQNKISYLLVDEYQDTNNIQYDLIKLLVGPKASFTVVGDDHQSVYSWRGARPENLKQLGIDFPTLKVIKLEQNYRSMGNILAAANAVISNNSNLFDKNLWSAMGPGEQIRIIATKDDEDEARQLGAEMLHHQFKNNRQFRDYAILYRGNHQSRLIEKSLRENKIPYIISGGPSFFTRTEVKDILAYLKLLVNQDDDGAFLRIVNTPRREIGTKTLEKLSNYAKSRDISLFAASFEIGLEQTLEGKGLEKLRYFTNWINLIADNISRNNDIVLNLTDFFAKLKYEDWLLETSNNPRIAEKKMENVTELLSWVYKLIKNEDEGVELTLDKALHKILLSDILARQAEDAQPNCVHLLTLHAAKGLEYPYVYIMGVEEELLPHRTSIEDDNIDDERRLCYVGITRAMRELTMTYAKERKRFGDKIANFGLIL